MQYNRPRSECRCANVKKSSLSFLGELSSKIKKLLLFSCLINKKMGKAVVASAAAEPPLILAFDSQKQLRAL